MSVEKKFTISNQLAKEIGMPNIISAKFEKDYDFPFLGIRFAYHNEKTDEWVSLWNDDLKKRYFQDTLAYRLIHSEEKDIKDYIHSKTEWMLTENNRDLQEVVCYYIVGNDLTCPYFHTYKEDIENIKFAEKVIFEVILNFDYKFCPAYVTLPVNGVMHSVCDLAYYLSKKNSIAMAYLLKSTNNISKDGNLFTFQITDECGTFDEVELDMDDFKVSDYIASIRIVKYIS